MHLKKTSTRTDPKQKLQPHGLQRKVPQNLLWCSYSPESLMADNPAYGFLRPISFRFGTLYIAFTTALYSDHSVFFFFLRSFVNFALQCLAWQFNYVFASANKASSHSHKWNQHQNKFLDNLQDSVWLSMRLQLRNIQIVVPVSPEQNRYCAQQK